MPAQTTPTVGAEMWWNHDHLVTQVRVTELFEDVESLKAHCKVERMEHPEWGVELTEFRHLYTDEAAATAACLETIRENKRAMAGLELQYTRRLKALKQAA